MKTITFYSYKGGVGRTLALSNIAKRLSEFGKRVCVIDFDLEAPGLHVKLRNTFEGQIEKGIVNYISDFMSSGNVPEDISQYAKRLRYPNDYYFIPAGNPSSSEYWKTLSQIDWVDLFYKDESVGIPFFIDMKQRIIEKFNPDYLLIDTRTGMTDMSAMTISVLADAIVVVAANNRENIDGCKRVITSLSNDDNNLFGQRKDIHFILSRIPLPEKPDERTREQALVGKIKSEIDIFPDNPNILIKSFNIIHSDRDLELEESIKIGYDFEKHPSPIASEYLKIFNDLTIDDLTEDERSKFNILREYEHTIAKGLGENDKEKALLLFDHAIELMPNLRQAHFEKIFVLSSLKRFEIVIEECTNLINQEIIVDNSSFYFLRAFSYYNLKKLKQALADLDEYKKFEGEDQIICRISISCKIQLEYSEFEILHDFEKIKQKYPDDFQILNLSSNYYRIINRIDDALNDIYKALELNTEEGVLYVTLAEIKAIQGDTQEFYRNLEMALKYGFYLKYIFDDDVIAIYLPFFKEDRFKNLLEKYDKFDQFEELLKKYSSEN